MAIRRVLSSQYVCQDFVYSPFVKQVITQSQLSTFHILMDRTSFTSHETDLVSVSFNFRKRAIPIAWTFMKHGMSNYELQK